MRKPNSHLCHQLTRDYRYAYQTPFPLERAIMTAIVGCDIYNSKMET